MPFTMMQNSSEQAVSLQNYMLLHSQHHALLKEIEGLSSASDPAASISITRNHGIHGKRSHGTIPPIPCDASTSKGSEENVILKSSSTLSQHVLNKTQSRHLTTSISTSTTAEITTTKTKLQEVNLQMKKTLTELLNSEDVRGDRRYRAWVQTRLLNVERELRGRRRDSGIGGLKGMAVEGEAF